MDKPDPPIDPNTRPHPRAQCPGPVKPHLCPYQQEINEDDEYTCTCCEDCTDECLQDI